MSKEQKITEDELLKLQEFVGNLNQVQMELGKLELQKSQAISMFAEKQAEMSEFQKELEGIYGQVNINVQDGTISVVEAEVEGDESNS